MNYTCLIVDDERPALKLLEAYIGKLPHLTLAAKCESAEEALAGLNQHQVDLLFLDIQMPGLTGLELLKTINVQPQVILTTAYRDFAVEGFSLNVVDYLLKPFSLERFVKAVNKASEQIRLQQNPKPTPTEKGEEPGEDDHVFVRTNHKMEKVIYSEIIYFESMREYVSIYTKKRRYVINQTMNHLEQVLPKQTFMRVHRSHIINLNHIDHILGNTISLGDKKITIGGSYRKGFFERVKLL